MRPAPVSAADRSGDTAIPHRRTPFPAVHRQGRGRQDLRGLRCRHRPRAPGPPGAAVSTDPASNLGHVFGLTVGATITAVAAVPGLSLLEIGPDETAAAYRGRIVGPVRNLLLPRRSKRSPNSCRDRAPPRSPRSTNSLVCSLPTPPARSSITSCSTPASTGHTIRLLQLPRGDSVSRQR